MNEFDHDMISRYLDDVMSPAERKVFEDQMQMDPLLQQEVELTREINETLRMKLHPDDNETALRRTISEISPEYFSKDGEDEKPKSKVVPLRLTMWLAVAAAVIVILFITVLSPGKQDLYQQYAYIEMPGVAERGNPADSLLQLANKKFNEQNFSESVPLFESILRMDTQNSFVRYYYAIALLESNEVERSRNELLQLYNGISILRYDAAFYIALSYLKEKNKSSCREWLKKIPMDAGISAKARELEGKL